MSEFEFIKEIKQKFYHQSNLEKGIGDDAAVFNHSNGNIVTAVDMFVEGIHFNQQTMTPFDIGYKSLAANLSDMAAMGATPKYYLVAVSVPTYWQTSLVKEIFVGMKFLAKKYSLDLIGGDTVSGKQLTISITIIGQVNNAVRYRHLAKKNDIVFVTGTLGDSQAGLHMLKNNHRKYIDKQYYIKRHQHPTPRVIFAETLSKIPRIALNDISDGIANEASEIAEASNVSIHLKAEYIPVKKSLKQFTNEQQFKWTYFGGEDFELLGTVSRENWQKVKQVARKTNTQLTEVGTVCIDNPGKVYLLSREKHPAVLKKAGYTHLL